MLWFKMPCYGAASTRVAGVPWISDGAWRRGCQGQLQEPKAERQLSIEFSPAQVQVSAAKFYTKLRRGHEFIFFSLILFFPASI